MTATTLEPVVLPVDPIAAAIQAIEPAPAPALESEPPAPKDFRHGGIVPEIIVDKRNIDEAMAGWPVDQELRTDGVVLTLYRGVEHPFIHALHSPEAWAVCIDLPTRGMDDAAATADWGVIATRDDRSTLAINATLGMIVDVHPQELSVRRVVDFEPSAQRGITLAKFGHGVAGSVGRRIVATPDGTAVYTYILTTPPPPPPPPPPLTLRVSSPRVPEASCASTRPT